MNFNQMQTFLEAVKLGGASRAARVLGISQPAVTQQIRRLEAELGVPLLKRGEDWPALTEAGERFRQFAARTVADYADLRCQLSTEPAVLSGQLRLGASTIPGEFVVPGLVARFREIHPNVEANLAIYDTAEVVSRLLAHEFEVGFVGAPVDRPELVTNPLVDDTLVLVVYSGHPFARRPFIRFAELAGQPLILRESGSGTMRSLRQAFGAVGLNLPLDNVVMTLGSSRAITSAVVAGLGIGFVSTLALTEESDERLIVVPIVEVKVKRQLYFLYEKERPKNRLCQAFIDFLVT